MGREWDSVGRPVDCLLKTTSTLTLSLSFSLALSLALSLVLPGYRRHITPQTTASAYGNHGLEIQEKGVDGGRESEREREGGGRRGVCGRERMTLMEEYMYSYVFVKGFMPEIFIILGLGLALKQIGCASFNHHHHHHHDLIPHISPSLRFFWIPNGVALDRGLSARYMGTIKPFVILNYPQTKKTHDTPV